MQREKRNGCDKQEIQIIEFRFMLEAPDPDSYLPILLLLKIEQT